MLVALRSWWSNPDAHIRQRLAAVAEAVPVADDDPRLLHIQALADPDGRAAIVLPRLSRHRPTAVNAEQGLNLGFAAQGVGAFGQSAEFRRARQELDATGERSSQPVSSALDALAPQELQIARLAARGLTNRQIAQQLYLSHRTVGHYLYLIFPKLGITSRGELAVLVAAAQN